MYTAQSRYLINVAVTPLWSLCALDRALWHSFLAEVKGFGSLLLGASHLLGGSGSRLQFGAPPYPALPAGRGPEAPLPCVFHCGFQHPKFGLRILREGGLSDLYSPFRSHLSADPVPCLAFRYGASGGQVVTSAWEKLWFP